MKRLATLAALAATTLVLVLPLTASGAVSGRTPAAPASRVVLILAPYVVWDDITAETTPAIWGAVERDAVGNLNSRSRTKEEGGGPSVVEGALTISSGAWTLPDSEAYAGYDVHERFEFDSAGEAFERLTGVPAGKNAIVYLGGPSTSLKNESDNAYDVVLGSLGQAVIDAGGATAAIGNSDLGYSSNVSRIVRPAAIAAMDKNGATMFGSVGDTILEQDANAPYGVRTDRAAVGEKMLAVRDEMAGYDAGLIVVDPGDLFRANRYASVVATSVAAAQWTDALTTLDEMYRTAVATFPDATVIVSSLASVDREENREGFGPLIITGMPEGVLTSASTQRAGLAVNPDVTSTIISVLGGEAPPSAIGAPVESSDEFTLGIVGRTPNTVGNRLDLLGKMNRLAVSLDATRVTVLNWFIGLTVAILAFGAFAVVRADRHWRPGTVTAVRRALYLLILGVLSVLVSSWLMFFFYRWPASPTAIVLQLLAVALALWVSSVWLSRRGGPHAALIYMAAATTAIIVVDQLFGAPASLASYFGYSPIAAFRFYGIGNEGASVLFGAIVIGFALALDRWGERPWAAQLKRWGIPAVALVTLVVAGAPMLGANVGVVAWGSVGFVLMWVLFNGRKVNAKSIAVMVLVVAISLAAFIALDRFGSGQETHLARSISSAETSGISALVEIVQRKVATNLRVLTRTNFAYILIAVIAYLAFMRWRPSRDFGKMLAAHPHVSQGMAVILVTGVAAYFTEDSGIVLPALLVLYLGCALVWLMLEPLTGNAALAETDE